MNYDTSINESKDRKEDDEAKGDQGSAILRRHSSQVFRCIS